MQRLIAELEKLQYRAALAIDHFALLVHHVIVFKYVFAGIEIETLDLRLRAFDGLGNELVLDGLVFRKPQSRHHTFHPLATETPHEFVFERYEKLRCSRVTLPSRPPAQLIIDAPRFVPLRTDNDETAHLPHPLTQLDIRSAPGHIGSDSHRVLLPGIGDDGRLAFMIL